MNENNSFEKSNDGDKALWDLLGRARKTDACPMFSRNVLREIRKLDHDASLLELIVGWFRRPVFLIGAAASVLFSGMILLQNQEAKMTSTELPSAYEMKTGFDPAREFESIEGLGELVAVSDPALLSDEALMNLLF